jgi:hypothetical protein
LIVAFPLASSAQSPELKVLQVQYNNDLLGKVTDVYNGAVGKLDTSYLGGLDKSLADAKAAGDLKSALNLEEEKKRIAAKEALPVNDEQASKPLKKLRGIYRVELAKLDAQRATNTAALLTPYIVKLKQLEADLTKADRLADAKGVMDYREGIAAGVPMKITATGAPAAAQPPTPTAAPPPAPIGSFGKAGFSNTLNMKFVPVTGITALVCIHPVRVQDYAAYAAEVSGVNGEWKTQTFESAPVGREDDHPVVGVNVNDTKEFCEWLSKKEGRTYRLPTDREWSFAVGIGTSEKITKDTTPQSLNQKVPRVWPWGNKWPPSKNSANLADTTFKAKFASKPNIEGYTDGFPATSPVLAFPPNKFGLYDMGGNIWQWCEDWLNEAKNERVLRGAPFEGHESGWCLSSNRFATQAANRRPTIGFRVVAESSAR